METAPPSLGLSQSGSATDICVGADNWQLQPRYVEREHSGGPLEVYRSAFGCGYIIRGVEPPARPVVARWQEVQESGGRLAADEESDGHPAAAVEESPGAQEGVQPVDKAVGGQLGGMEPPAAAPEQVEKTTESAGTQGGSPVDRRQQTRLQRWRRTLQRYSRIFIAG